MPSLIIHCADIGSVAKGNFGWARFDCADQPTCTVGQDITDFADAIASDLNANHPIALGFECPLFVPVPDDPKRLTSARTGEGNRPWSAGAGAGSLATGLTETIWILTRIQRQLKLPTPIHLRWTPFQQTRVGLFIWEAFVSGDAKSDTHHGDAEFAVNQFFASLPDPEAHNAITCANARSLIGAALLQSGMSDDLTLLHQQCLVVRVTEPMQCVTRIDA